MNVSVLTEDDLEWADYVFISAMVVQKKSTMEVIRRCEKLGIKMVAGGPLFTSRYEEFEDINHLVLNEAEGTLPSFLDDLKKGCTHHIYTSKEWPDLRETPPPQWELINMKKYDSMCIQYSRGCPFNCEFCDVVVLNGHKPRTKSKDQILEELEVLYSRGWRSSVFFVDDNFIGNRKRLNIETLMNGYKKILNTIYSPKHYYKRVITFLKGYKPKPLKKKINLKFSNFKAFLKSIWLLGIKGKERLHYWKLISWTLVRRPRFFHLAISLAIYGFHFRKIVEI